MPCATVELLLVKTEWATSLTISLAIVYGNLYFILFSFVFNLHLSLRAHVMLSRGRASPRHQNEKENKLSVR